MRRKCLLLMGVFGLLGSALPTLAHHSVTAEFDTTKEFVVKGVLTKVEWTNPHVYYFVDGTDANGQVTTYSFEIGPPSVLHRAGMKKEDFKIGDTVTVTASPAKDGSKTLGWGKMIKYSDGHIFVYRVGNE